MTVPAEMKTSLMINGDRLWKNLMEMAKIGATPKNGSSRLAMTAVDSDGRRKFLKDCADIGLSMKSDAIGNMFVRDEGSDPTLDPVVMGSHLDTQPLGGRFDGVYGVLSGLEVLRTLHENGIRTKRPIELVTWTNEEGSRFAPAMMGSAVYVGKLSLEEALAKKDSNGETLGESLKREGWAGDAPFQRKFDSYFEAHIEQGPILEEKDLDIGVVTGGQAIYWLDLVVKGKQAHAGTFPMSMRQDTFMAAADLALRLEKIALDRLPDAKLTVGELDITAPSRNVIPGEIRVSLDLRHPLDEVTADMGKAVREIAQQVSKARGVDIQVQDVWKSPAQPFSDECISLVDAAANSLGYSSMRIISGAGHDAILTASSLCPTSMIFIPCRGGISHAENEHIEPDQAEKGANVLLRAVLSRANA